MLPEVSEKYLGSGKSASANAWAILVLPVKFQHPLSNDSIPLRDFHLWLENGESEGSSVKAKFSMTMSGNQGLVRVLPARTTSSM